MSAKNNLIKILAGGVIGSVITLLLAPKSGKILQKEIKNKTDETKAISLNKESIDRKLHKADLRNSTKNKEDVVNTKLKTDFRNNKMEHHNKRHKDKFD
jgi:gas vesicle protein